MIFGKKNLTIKIAGAYLAQPMLPIWLFNKLKLLIMNFAALKQKFTQQEIEKAIHKITFQHLESITYKESTTGAVEAAILRAINEILIKEKHSN